MPAPYRRASGYSCLVVVITFIGIAGGIAIAMNLPKDGPWWIIMGGVSLPIIIALVIGLTLSNRLERNRVEAIGEALFPLGYVFSADPTDEEKAAFFEPMRELEGWAQLRGGAPLIVWLATLPTHAGRTCVFAHQHITGSGKSTQIHDSTVVALVEPTGQTNGLAAHRPRFGERRWIKKMGDPLNVVGDDRFAKDWVVFGDPAAASFLVPDVREALADSPRGESLYVGPNFRACGYKGQLDAENLLKFIRRAEPILRGIEPPDELGLPTDDL